MPARLDDVRSATPETIASATLSVETRGEGFTEITRDVADFLRQVSAQDGVLLAYLRHTSASLVIQENADPDVQADLVTALDRLAPADVAWVHDTEGPDDMPAHVKAMLNGISLHVPVTAGALALGTWQGIYLAEHRARINCQPAPNWTNLNFSVGKASGRTIMTRPMSFARAALGATVTLIIASAALAQNQPPPPAPPASPYGPTATITTPGYPGVGPADFKLRAMNLPNGKKLHMLPATLDTTQWGWFDNAQPPVLRVNSGDTIALETMMHSHNQVVPGTTIEQIKKTRTDFPGRGPHTLTGPIYIEEAQPGDVLKVTLNKIVPRAYATNFNVPGLFGQFPSIYQDGQVKYLYLDLDKMQTEFLPGIILPLKPFPGTLGVARKEPGRYSSVPPGEYAGNMDIRDFVAGTSLYVPVHVPGALLWTGDSHAGQGNGEVNLTAIETAYRELNLTVEVIKGKPLDFPRIETLKSWITMGFDQDLNKAWAQTKAQTIKLLSEQRKVSAEQAEKLMAGVSDCRVSQVVNVKKGIHCLNPKNARDKEDMERPTKETAKYLVSHVKDADLNKAMNDASLGMIKQLESAKKIARLDAYGLASVAMDCRVGAISDTEKNVHCLMPKSIWVAGRR